MFRRSLLFGVLLLAATVVLAEDCRRGFPAPDYLFSSDAAVYGDFNEDGHVDVILNVNTRTYLVLNRGFEYFAPAVALPVFDSLSQAVVIDSADVNRDGHLDLIIRYGLAPGTAWGISFGDGKGNFAAPVVSALEPTALQVDFLDINGDGVKDLFYKDSAGRLLVQLGSSDGHFGPPRVAASDVSPAAQYRLGDFDGDGATDLYWVGLVWWNDGKGNFVADSSTYVGLSPLLAAFDFDRDGAADLLFPADTGHVKLARFRGRRVTFDTIDSADDLSDSYVLEGVGDFDGDGYPDALFQPGIVVWGASSPGRLDVTRLNVLTAPSHVSLGGERVVDLDGDGLPDIAGRSGNPIVVFHGKRGSRQLQAANEIELPGPHSSAVYTFVGDLNGDGMPDVVSYDLVGGLGVVYLADGRGGLQYHGSFASGEAANQSIASRRLGFGDFDGDGKVDIAYGDPAKVRFGDGTGGFTDPVTIPNSLVVGSGHLERGGKSIVFLNAGTNLEVATFAADRSYTVSAPVTTIVPTAILAPIDIDGVAALVLMANDSTSAQVVRKGSTGWGIAATLPDQPYADAAVAADFDRDGRDDLVVCSSFGCTVAFDIGNGLGVTRQIPSVGFQLFAADMDGDGNIDLVGSGGIAITVFRNRGDATFEQQAETQISDYSGGRLAAVADMNGDGGPDAIVVHSSNVEVLPSECIDVPFAYQLVPAVPLVGDTVKIQIPRGFGGYLYEGSQLFAYGASDGVGSTWFTLTGLTAGTHTYTFEGSSVWFGAVHETIRVTVLPSIARRHAVRH